ncbi:PREDICTED: uncharacterized protein LOC108363165 [Rhagoletis zephyria]|uniref:uncharacterized protein LOC108359469 n=1 Tax=Rhagoletis zephyria TaxID=28612 RepID=UPI000811A294|nr:PREDICTED: uncharacterized protein LOC108359469 [Rhagoletis zephyria]XP_017471936.1 PREDICTED: uncharacterized protein LOC108363165 [Rhagoletis zephyria]XP_036335271.1 uncharacterized protein LOC118745739 [Rhagoletis pomonella]
MPTTRSTTSKEREGDSNDELNNTVCEHPAGNSQGESTIEMRLNEIMMQMKSLQDEMQRIRQPQSVIQLEANQITNTVDSESIGVITTASSEVGHSQHNSSMGRAHKLYDLPEFDGRPEDWPMFKETFAMTTAEYQYSNPQNMMRLQRAIKGRAREAVECLLIHSRNVPQIMSTLQECFGRPELLVKSQISRIRSIAPISENRIEQLITFATKVQNLSSFLQAAECDHHLSNPTLMEEPLMKLPVQRRIEWARHTASIVPRPTICHFSTWLQELSRIVSTACSFSSLEPRPNRVEGRTRFFYANETNASSNRNDRCDACSEKHTLSKCNKFLGMNYVERWRLARSKKVCFNCLKGHHRSNACTEQHECNNSGCTRRVHSLLHETHERNRWQRNN